MGLFGKKKDNGEIEQNLASETVVEPAVKSNEELQNLINDFKNMKSGAESQYEEEEEVVDEEVIEDEYHGGEEYEVSEDESASIESFLSSPDEEIEEETVEEDVPLEEEVVEEEDYEEGDIDTSSYMSRYETEDAEEEVEQIEEDAEDYEVAAEEEIYEEPGTEEEIVEEDTIDEPISNYDEEGAEEEIITQETKETVNEDDDFEPVVETKSKGKENFVTSEDIDKKFDEFEKRLLDKLMASMASFGQFAANQVKGEDKAEPVVEQPVKQLDAEDVNLRYENGKLMIDDYTCTGEVVMFTKFESVKKATWEEVVRRKGHCTYHLTTSGNGGYFIKKSNAPNPYAYIEKKEDAVELAKAYAKREKAELKIHNAKGVIEQSLSYGREKLRG